MIKNARALQSVAMSAVMAMTGWLLIVENGNVETALRSNPDQVIPATQALTQAPLEPQTLVPGDVVQRQVAADGWAYFSVKAPADANSLRFQLTSHEGDADLYVREDEIPVGTVAAGGMFEASSATQGTPVEQISLNDAADRHWVIAVHGYRAGRFSLQADIE